MNGKFWAGQDLAQKQWADKGLTCSSIFDQPSSFLSERGGKDEGRWEGRRERASVVSSKLFFSGGSVPPWWYRNRISVPESAFACPRRQGRSSINDGLKGE